MGKADRPHRSARWQSTRFTRTPSASFVYCVGVASFSGRRWRVLSDEKSKSRSNGRSKRVTVENERVTGLLQCALQFGEQRACFGLKQTLRSPEDPCMCQEDFCPTARFQRRQLDFLKTSFEIRPAVGATWANQRKVLAARSLSGPTCQPTTACHALHRPPLLLSHRATDKIVARTTPRHRHFCRGLLYSASG